MQTITDIAKLTPAEILAAYKEAKAAQDIAKANLDAIKAHLMAGNAVDGLKLADSGSTFKVQNTEGAMIAMCAEYGLSINEYSKCATPVESALAAHIQVKQGITAAAAKKAVRNTLEKFGTYTPKAPIVKLA